MTDNILETLENAEQYFAVIDHYNGLIDAYKKDTMLQKDKYWNTKFIKKPFIGISILILFASVVFSVIVANILLAMRYHSQLHNAI